MEEFGEKRASGEQTDRASGRAFFGKTTDLAQEIALDSGYWFFKAPRLFPPSSTRVRLRFSTGISAIVYDMKGGIGKLDGTVGRVVGG